jgi:ubiquinone/menaquinone biosynthesis C-methylase UbiE
VLRGALVVLARPPIGRPRRIAAAYLKGHGLEIGALHARTAVPPGARVRYVDRKSRDDLRREYPNTDQEGFNRVDIVDDAQTLATVPDSSEDFIIANHVIEHVEDPMLMVQNSMRVLKPGGVLLLTIPDKRRTFDVERPVTTLQHVLDDHEDRGRGSRLAHYREWAESIENIPAADVEARVAELTTAESNIHFHVWTAQGALDLTLRLGDILGFEIEFVALGGIETVVVLRKCQAAGKDLT